jgi:hypothetical protein
VGYKLPPPERELRWYPRNAWRGWIPIPEPLSPEFDDRADVDAIIARVHRCGRLDSGELYTPTSGDSWQAFCGQHGTYGFFDDWQPEYQRSNFAPLRPVSTRAQVEQEKWEAEALARRRAKQVEQDRLWAEEEQRRRAQVLAEHGAEAVADVALNTLMEGRFPTGRGRSAVGAMNTHCEFSRKGSDVAAEMRGILPEIPRRAVLSTAPRPTLPGYQANITKANQYAAVTVFCARGTLRLDVTWDYR